MPNLRIKTGPNRDQVTHVGENPVGLGREPSCAIQLYDHAASRNHAEVFRIGEMCFVRDLGSRNSTFVNEEKIEEELLRVGDKIRIGSTVIVFEDDEAEATKDEDAEESLPNVKFHDGEEEEEEPEEEAEEEESGPDEATIELNLDRKQLSEIRAAGAGKEVAAHLGILFDLSKAISAESHLKPLMEKILSIAAEGVRAKVGVVFLRDVRTDQFTPKAHTGIEKGEDLKVSRTIIRRVAKYGKAVLTTDAARDARFKSTESVVLQGIHSVLCVPLVSHEQTIGILYLESPGVDQPFKPEDLDLVTSIGFQAAIAIQNVSAQTQQRRVLSGAIRTLVAALEMHNPEMQGHSERVCTYSAAVASQMKLSEMEKHNVQLAALLHDIGKVAATNKESEAEGDQPKEEEHVLLGVKLLENMPGMDDVLPGIKSHHEKSDGTGVPDGLSGDNIPLLAKIVAVGNTLDHLMTKGGEGGTGITTKEALLELSKMGGQALDSEVVAALFVAHRSGQLFSPKTLFDAPISEKDS